MSAVKLTDRLRAIWDGLSVADLATLDEAATLIEAQAARIERLEERLRGLLRCEYESAGTGLYDCIDNTGKPYQSADLDTQIKLAEQMFSTPAARALNGGE